MPQPPFEPTDEQRQMVETLSGCGMPQDKIAALVINPRTGKGISTHTLWKFFEDEIAGGSAQANATVAQNLYRVATSEEISGPVVTAMIFWMKCRAGWREVSRMEHTGAKGAPLIPDAVDQLRHKLNRLAGITEDAEETDRMN